MPAIKLGEKEVTISHRLGDILKIERERRRHSLEQVSDELNIKKAYLKQLEDNKYNSLPADIYTRSYIRRYADFLHLKDDVLLKLYDHEKSFEDKEISAEKEENVIRKGKSPSFSFILNPKAIKITAVVVLFVAFVAYLWYQVSDFSSPPELAIIEPSENEQTIKENNIVVIGETSSDATMTINSQPIHLTSEGKFKETISLQPGINTLQFEVTNRLGKKQMVEKKVLVE